MDVFTTFDVAGSAMNAQRTRLNIVSSNIANAETTSTPEGGPYKKKSVYFESTPMSFQQTLQNAMNNQNGVDNRVDGVRVAKIVEDDSPPMRIYNPSHPDADQDGYVDMPNVSVLKEFVDMTAATRGYEANATVIKSAKRMALKAIEIGR